MDGSELQPTDPEALPQEVAQALVGGVDPSRLDAFRFAESILPAFELIKSLFSRSALDTCLKLMLLHELARTPGRFRIDAIRSAAAFLDPGRVDDLVRSLRDGGWLELRASDNTYVVAPAGIHLLAVLHGSDFGRLSPANALARVAQSAAFAATLEGAEGSTAFLLDQLLVLVENQVEEARAVLQQGRPLALIAWSRRHHLRQLQVIRDVLGELEKRGDLPARDLGRVILLHRAMQGIVDRHRGIHARLREWNVDRLHSTKTGYSVPELVEAVLGADDETLQAVADRGIVQAPALPPTLGTREIKDRFQGVRRRQSAEAAEFRYRPPPPPDLGAHRPGEGDPAAELAAHLAAALAGRTPDDPPLELEDWLRGDDFPEEAFQVVLLARLHHGGARLRLPDGRTAELRVHTDPARGVPPEQLLQWLEDAGALRRLAGGWFTRMTLAVVEDEGPAPQGGQDA